MKRLLISIPSGPHGFYSQELAWWLTSVQIQSTIKEFGELMCEEMSSRKHKRAVRKAAREFGVAFVAEQAELQWANAQKINDIWAPMIPDGWSVTVAPVVGFPLAANRNEQVRKFLLYCDHASETLRPTDFDAALFIDTDNLPGRQDLHLLCKDIERDDVDIVGGVYCLEGGKDGPAPVVYTLASHGKGFHYDKRTLSKDRDLHKLDNGALPAGCLMVKRHVFEKMWEARRVWFKDKLYDASLEHYELKAILDQGEKDPVAALAALKAAVDGNDDDWVLPNIGKWHIGEDIWFCYQALEMGFALHADTRVFWGHIKKADNKMTFQRQEYVSRKMFELGQKNADRDYRELMAERAEGHQQRDEAIAAAAAKALKSQPAVA